MKQRYNTIDEIRRANLRRLVKAEGSQRSLADKAEIAPAQVSQWITAAPDSKTGKPRVISDESARALESAVGKPIGWMDHEHSDGCQAAPDGTDGPISSGACGGLPEALDLLGAALAAIPADMREVVTTNLSGWARAGGKEPWRSVVLSLLSIPPGKRQFAA